MAPRQEELKQEIKEQRLGEATHPYTELIKQLNETVQTLLTADPDTNTFEINNQLIKDGLVKQVLDDPRHLEPSDRENSMSQAMAVADWENSLLSLISNQVNLHAGQPFLKSKERGDFINTKNKLQSSEYNRNGKSLGKLLLATSLIMPYLSANKSDLVAATRVEKEIVCWNLDFKFFQSDNFQQFLELGQSKEN